MIDGNTFSALYEYCNRSSNIEDPLLYDLYRETHLKTLKPRMASGPLQGKFLSLLARLTNAKSILEIGTFTGYATLCLAKGMHPEGQIHTIEINPELNHISKKYFEKSEFSHAIHAHIGDAIEIISALDLQFDLVFMDAKKTDYQTYFDTVFPKMLSGGLILADNVLWDGKVLTDDKGKSTIALKKFNDTMKKDPRIDVLLLPLRDGLSIMQVK